MLFPEPDVPQTLTTDGSATAYFPPDAARLFFRIETEAPTVPGARSQNAADFDRVGAALKGLNIPDLKIRTGHWTMSPQYTQPGPEAEPPQLRAYRAVHSFTVLLTDPSAEQLSTNASRVLVAALENGVNVLEGVSFFKQDDQEIYLRTLGLAVEDALRKARTMADAAGVKIKPRTLTNTGPAGAALSGGRQSVPLLLTGDAPLVAGDVVITCTIRLVCEFT